MFEVLYIYCVVGIILFTSHVCSSLVFETQVKGLEVLFDFSVVESCTVALDSSVLEFACDEWASDGLSQPCFWFFFFCTLGVQSLRLVM